MAVNTDTVDQLPKGIRSLLDTPYAQYLGLEMIFDLQISEGVPVQLNHAEEVIFRTVHMSSELWLRLAGFEIERTRSAVEAGQIVASIRLAQRARMSVERVMEATSMLQMMPAVDYHTFRTELGNASGLQSPGYAYLRRECKGLGNAFDVAVGDDDALFEFYMGDRSDPRYDLAEALLDLDATLDRFRSLHLQIAERFLGGNTQGTGGSEGVPYLKRNIGHKLFPRLWDLRERIATASGATSYGYGTPDPPRR
ncbi:MAG TPA: tryptophan 2,3-dioxygenase family protein [Thermomicrobiales bacterium]|nr:tryptophan 2,3-dioxygenase family protein [Thermomicrobiales bacterium]